MKRYRPNVCVVLTDEQRERVLVFRRVDQAMGEHPWQFPQGGLDPGEAPEQGMLRELREEIGTGDVRVLARGAQPIRYEYPPDVLAALIARDPEKGRYIGQEQHWFLALLEGGTGEGTDDGTAAIHFDHQPPEFDAFRWVTPAEAVEAVVPFKRAAYREALRQLGLLPPE